MSPKSRARRRPAAPRKPRAVQPRAEQPRAEQPRAEQPRAEQPRAEQPRAEQPRAEQSAGPSSGPGWAESIRQQALGHAVSATCWLDPGNSGDRYPVSVRFSGRRAGASGQPQQGDRFDHTETLGDVVPGSGPVSVTAKVRDVTP